MIGYLRRCCLFDELWVEKELNEAADRGRRLKTDEAARAVREESESNMVLLVAMQEVNSIGICDMLCRNRAARPLNPFSYSFV